MGCVAGLAGVTNLLRRFWARSCRGFGPLHGMLEMIQCVPKRSKSNRLSQAANPISGQSDSEVSALVNKKRKLLSEPPQLAPLAGIEPASLSAVPGLLRVQSAMVVFLGPGAGTDTCADRLSRD
jgi:hypothetical protein